MKIVYEPNQRSKMGFFKTLFVIIQNIRSSRELIFQLYRRDLFMQYKKSFLGMGWMLFAPIMSIVSWIVMNAAGVLSPGDVGVPYPVYVLLSTSIWGLFINLYTSSGQTLQVAQSFIQQVNFHHEALLIKQALQDLTNFSITIVINVVVMLLFKITPHWQIFLLPVLVIPIFLIAASLGMIVSIVSTITLDMQRIATFLLSLLMFITPVIYSSKLNLSLVNTIIYYNPLTYIVCGPRDLILYGKMDNISFYWICILLSILMFIMALRFFFVSEKKVIEKMI